MQKNSNNIVLKLSEQATFWHFYVKDLYGSHLAECHRRTYHTILKLAEHALFKMVWYVLLRPLRPEFMPLGTHKVNTFYRPESESYLQRSLRV
jgi:hypothetical protein